MPVSDDDYRHHCTYFGLFSAEQRARVSAMLESLNVRYEFLVQDEAEERLREWMAWDPTAVKPHEGHELFIHSADLEKLGTAIIEMYPERKFTVG